MGKNWALEYKHCEERCQNIGSIPPNFQNWMEGLFQETKWMVYKRHGSYADLFCCECGKEGTVRIKVGESYEDQFIKTYPTPVRGEIGTCPWCGKKVLYKAGVRNDHEECKYIWLGQKYGDKSYVLRYFEAWERYGPNKKKEYSYRELARVFYQEGRKSINKDYFLIDNYAGETRWCPHNVGGLGNYTTGNGYIYPETYRAMKDTVMEYCMARQYVNTEYKLPVYKCNEWYWDIERYLSQYWRYPILEMLIKANAKGLTSQIVGNTENYLRLDRRAKDPWDVLRINKFRIKDLLKKDSRLTWEWYKYERDQGKRIDDNLIEWYAGEGINPEGTLREITRKTSMTLVQIKNYLIRQAREANSQSLLSQNAPRTTRILITWADYLSMAEQQGHDLKDAIVYRPKDIESAHARVVKEAEFKNASETASKYYQKHPKIKNVMRKAAVRYAYRNEKYIMMIPKTIEDVLIEGRALHHCISASDRYIGRMAAEETYIGFVRRAKKPETPFYSIEFEPGGTVRQKRTYYNRHDEYLDEVIEFLREWQEYVKATMTPQEKRKARISKRRRVEDLQDFYKKDPVFAKETEKDLLENSNIPQQVMIDVRAIQEQYGTEVLAG